RSLEGRNRHLTVDQHRSKRVRQTELCLIGRGRVQLPGPRFADQALLAARNLAVDRCYVIRFEAAVEQCLKAFEKWLDIMAGGTGLQRRFAKMPMLAQSVQVASQARRRLRITCIGRVKAMSALEDAGRPGHAGFGETRR